MNKWKFYQEINTETNRASEIICFEDRNGFFEFFIYLFIYLFIFVPRTKVTARKRL